MRLPCDVADEVLRALNGDDGWRSGSADQLLKADERARSNHERRGADILRKRAIALGAFSAALVSAFTQCRDPILQVPASYTHP